MFTLKIEQLGELTIAAQRAAIAAVFGKKDKFLPKIAQGLVNDYGKLSPFFGEFFISFVSSAKPFDQLLVVAW